MSRDYYDKGGISCYDYIQAKGLNFAEGCVVKYVTRWRFKAGVEDLKKAQWYLSVLINEAGAGAPVQCGRCGFPMFNHRVVFPKDGEGYPLCPGDVNDPR